VDDARIVNSLKSLRDRLHDRARELQSAQSTVHALRLEQLAQDRQIRELQSKVAELEFLLWKRDFS